MIGYYNFYYNFHIWSIQEIVQISGKTDALNYYFLIVSGWTTI